jgi:dethiobiotin synthase
MTILGSYEKGKQKSMKQKMTLQFPELLFVSGTDTDIGKTVVSSMLIAGLKAGYWKPVQAGRDPVTDTEFVQQLTGLPDSHFYPETYNLKTPMSPHAAAEIDNMEIGLDRISVPNYTQKHLIIEGAGGLIVPLNERDYIIDLIHALNIPVLLVAKSGLGTLNHTLLSIEALNNRTIQIFGVVLVGETHHSNEQAILHYGRVEKLFRVPHLKQLNPQTIENQFYDSFSKPVV